MEQNDDIEIEDNYVDIEDLLERQRYPEKAVRRVRNLANFYISLEQLNNKGKLLGHFKSTGLLKTYIDVYERAIIGKAEISRSKKPEAISWGYACLAEAIVVDGVFYLVMKDERVYRLRHLKEAEIIAYMINGQRLKTMNEDADESGKQ